jgi:catechol 2,3-dioxygenase-like lactoylglutathione lyase family enzyme
VDARRHPQGRTGLDHIGFLVDDMEKSAATLTAAGSEHVGQISRTRADANIERKYRDPDGLVFDIVTAEHARPVWGIPA